MRLLLDTQTLVWTLERESLLSVVARENIITADEVYISPVNFYEIVIKVAIGKDAGITQPISELIQHAIESGFIWLPMSPDHIDSYMRLPFYEQHRDPFDRMILATALAEGLTVVSSDRNFPLYNHLVRTLW